MKAVRGLSYIGGHHGLITIMVSKNIGYMHCEELIPGGAETSAGEAGSFIGCQMSLSDYLRSYDYVYV